MTRDSYAIVQERLLAFARDRDWRRFHTPRNLALALAGEAGELCAEFRWVSDDEVSERLEDRAFLNAIASEAADVLTFLIYFADSCGIDLLAATMDKLTVNEKRYPADRVFGSARKWDDLPSID